MVIGWMDDWAWDFDRMRRYMDMSDDYIDFALGIYGIDYSWDRMLDCISEDF